MVQMFNPRSRREVVTKEDQEKPESDRTVFYVRPLSAMEMLDIQNSIVQYIDLDVEGDKQFAGARVTADAAKAAIVGWKNLRDAETKTDVPFEKRLIEHLPLNTLLEIGNEVISQASLDPDAEGN